MEFAGFQKVTLLDYPERTACTAFTAGCNFRCPFCHNAEIAFSGKNAPEYCFSGEEILDYLMGRKGKLDGICITGGEPLLHKEVIDFAKQAHERGFLVKIDTNGSVYDRLEYIIGNGLCDYVAMDIKNTPEKYPLSAGCSIDIESVKKSVELLKQGKVEYEFRTTVVKELNKKEDFTEIAKWLQGARLYCLQKFKDSERVPEHGFTAYTDAEMREIKEILSANGLKNVILRGTD